MRTDCKTIDYMSLNEMLWDDMACGWDEIRWYDSMKRKGNILLYLLQVLHKFSLPSNTFYFNIKNFLSEKKNRVKSSLMTSFQKPLEKNLKQPYLSAVLMRLDPYHIRLPTSHQNMIHLIWFLPPHLHSCLTKHK